MKRSQADIETAEFLEHLLRVAEPALRAVDLMRAGPLTPAQLNDAIASIKEFARAGGGMFIGKPDDDEFASTQENAAVASQAIPPFEPLLWNPRSKNTAHPDDVARLMALEPVSMRLCPRCGRKGLVYVDRSKVAVTCAPSDVRYEVLWQPGLGRGYDRDICINARDLDGNTFGCGFCQPPSKHSPEAPF